MAASSTDYFTEVGNPGTATNLASPGHLIGGTTFNVGSTSNWPTTTGVIFAIDTVSLINGEEVRDVGSYTEWEATVTSGTVISSAVLRYGSDQNYPAGSTTRVYIPVASSRENRLAQGLVANVFNQDATLKTNVALTTNAATLTSPKVITGINDTNNNELFKVTATASAVNELTVANAATGNAPVLSATGGDTNVDIRLAPKGTGNVKRGTTGGSIDWWEEIGRTTLSGTADVISITGLPSRKYLKVRISMTTSSTVDLFMRFNNDSAAHYANSLVINGGAALNTSNDTQISVSAGANSRFYQVEAVIDNNATFEKPVTFTCLVGVGGSASAPITVQGFSQWSNTSTVINRIDLVNANSGDYISGAEMTVMGHD